MVSNYYAYLVRMWREHADAPWRVRVQAVESGEVFLFASLSEFVVFLEQADEKRSQPNSSRSSDG